MLLCKTCRYANWHIKKEHGIIQWEFLGCDKDYTDKEIAHFAVDCMEYEEPDYEMSERDPDIAWKEAHGE